MSPTLTPAIVTVCPWPGTTAWAVESSAWSSKKSLPIPGTQPGRVKRWFERM